MNKFSIIIIISLLKQEPGVYVDVVQKQKERRSSGYERPQYDIPYEQRSTLSAENTCIYANNLGKNRLDDVSPEYVVKGDSVFLGNEQSNTDGNLPVYKALDQSKRERENHNIYQKLIKH